MIPDTFAPAKIGFLFTHKNGEGEKEKKKGGGGQYRRESTSEATLSPPQTTSCFPGQAKPFSADLCS